MPEEPENQETPERDEPQEETVAESEAEDSTEAPEEENWQERYADAQAWGTRASQEAARLEQENAQLQEYLQQRQSYENLPADEQLLARIAALEEGQTLLSQEQQEAQELAAFEAFVEDEVEKLDPENTWSDTYYNAVLSLADTMADEDGVPNLKKAHEALQADEEEKFKQRVKGKRLPQAPSGASPIKTEDLDDPEVRRDYMTRAITEGM